MAYAFYLFYFATLYIIHWFLWYVLYQRLAGILLTKLKLLYTFFYFTTLLLCFFIHYSIVFLY